MPDIDPARHANAHAGTLMDYFKDGVPDWAKLGALGVGSYGAGQAINSNRNGCK